MTKCASEVPAIYGRVSSEQQAEAATIDSQVAALEERIADDGLTLETEMRFLDEGYSGVTLIRPALECSATIILSLERQLEFPSEKQRRGAPLLQRFFWAC